MGLECQPARCRIAWKRQGGEGWTQKEHLLESVARIWARDDNAALGCRAATGCREGVSFLQGQARGQRRPAWGGRWPAPGPANGGGLGRSPSLGAGAGGASAAGSPGYQRCRIPAELLAPRSAHQAAPAPQPRGRARRGLAGPNQSAARSSWGR